MALGIGLSVNNARAVVEALFGHKTGFTRTPKLGVKEPGDSQGKRKGYRSGISLQPLVELALAVYFTFAVIWVLDRHVYYSLPFLVLFQAGFAYVGLASMFEGLRELWGRFTPMAAPSVDV
jgi:hypothetical protein